MDNKLVTRYFLGSNSKDGFASLYDSFVDCAGGDFLWVIKGGPGCGKSSFMKRIGRAARENGLAVEYIHCSGDPDSLDAVWLPEKRVGYVDGTAPHVMEATYPGVSSQYLDLGRFYDTAGLAASREAVVSLNRRYKALYKAAYDQLAAAACVSPRIYPDLWGSAQQEKIARKVNGFVSRELRWGSGSGKVKHRFLSAYSCKGHLFLEESLHAQCSRLCVLDNEWGLAWCYLEQLTKQAAEKGYDLILCHDPLFPEKPEAVLIPELSLGLVAAEKNRVFSGKTYRHLRLDTLADKSSVNANRARLRQCRKSHGLLLESAMDSLAQAKALHDELERLYNPHVDFGGLYALADTHSQRLFSCGTAL